MNKIRLMIVMLGLIVLGAEAECGKVLDGIESVIIDSTEFTINTDLEFTDNELGLATTIDRKNGISLEARVWGGGWVGAELSLELIAFRLVKNGRKIVLRIPGLKSDPLIKCQIYNLPMQYRGMKGVKHENFWRNTDEICRWSPGKLEFEIKGLKSGDSEIKCGSCGDDGILIYMKNQ